MNTKVKDAYNFVIQKLELPIFKLISANKNYLKVNNSEFKNFDFKQILLAHNEFLNLKVELFKKQIFNDLNTLNLLLDDGFFFNIVQQSISVTGVHSNNLFTSLNTSFINQIISIYTNKLNFINILNYNNDIDIGLDIKINYYYEKLNKEKYINSSKHLFYGYPNISKDPNIIFDFINYDAKKHLDSNNQEFLSNNFFLPEEKQINDFIQNNIFIQEILKFINKNPLSNKSTNSLFSNKLTYPIIYSEILRYQYYSNIEKSGELFHTKIYQSLSERNFIYSYLLEERYDIIDRHLKQIFINKDFKEINKTFFFIDNLIPSIKYDIDPVLFKIISKHFSQNFDFINENKEKNLLKIAKLFNKLTQSNIPCKIQDFNNISISVIDFKYYNNQFIQFLTTLKKIERGSHSEVMFHKKDNEVLLLKNNDLNYSNQDIMLFIIKIASEHQNSTVEDISKLWKEFKLSTMINEKKHTKNKFKI